MSVEIIRYDNIVALRPVGRLDSFSSPELEKVVSQNLEGGVTRLVFDFSNVPYISSAGLRVVLFAGKKLRAASGKLALTGMNDMVRDIFEMSGFLSLFAVASTLEAAYEQV